MVLGAGRAALEMRAHPGDLLVGRRTGARHFLRKNPAPDVDGQRMTSASGSVERMTCMPAAA